MKSLRAAAAALQDPPPQTSVRGLSSGLNLPQPISLKNLVGVLLTPVSFHGDITTPSGTALGGTVDLTIAPSGDFSFNVHMHDSGWDPYRFTIRCALKAPSGLTLLFQTSGHTDGTGSSLTGTIHRDFDHNEVGVNPMIRLFWTDVRFSTLAVSKSYDDVGLLNGLEDLAKDLIGFLIADVTLGAGLALVVCVSADLAGAFNAGFVGPGGLVGIVVAGGIAWVWGPSAIIASIVLGVSAGALTDALIKHRSMTQEEYDFAGIVFGNTLPPRETIYITNLSHGGGRKYTWPEIDGSIILNLGDDAFDDPIHHSDKAYPTRGQVFIHEMTHAWQIKTKSFIPGVLCKYIVQTDAYSFGFEGQAWNELGIEQQALTVDSWFGQYAGNWLSAADVAKNLASQPAITDHHFGYIQNNIRLGQN
jgi:hypothetical protein